MTASNALDPLLRSVAAALTDLGVRRARRHLIVDGEDGDRIVVQPQRSASGYEDTVVFHCNVALCLLPYAAWARGATLAQARSFTYRPGDALVQDRVLSVNGWPPGMWTVTPATLPAVAGDLAAALRAALLETWLPLLPRAALRAALRDRDRPLPGPTVNRSTGELMCVLPDASTTERAQVAAFLDARGDGDLAAWLRCNFP
jgi:hypothetical protein